MKVGRTSFGALVVSLALSLSAAARAGEPGPPVEQPEVEPYDDEQAPPVEVPQPVPPPVQPPAAQGPAPEVGFGYAGMIAISDDVQLAISQVSSDFMGQSTKRTQIQLRPALDFFVLPNFSVGGQLVIGYTSVDPGNGQSASQTELGASARIGYTFALGTSTSIWPRVSFGYQRPAGDGPVVPGNSQYNLTFEVYVPIVVQPVQHFFIGAGPVVSTQVVSKMNDVDAPKTTTIGVLSTLGGCFRAM